MRGFEKGGDQVAPGVGGLVRAGLGQPLELRFWGSDSQPSAQEIGMYLSKLDEKGSLEAFVFLVPSPVLWHCPQKPPRGPSQPLQELMFRPLRAGHAGGGARGTGVRSEEAQAPREGAGCRASIQSG